mgnify:FL=1
MEEFKLPQPQIQESQNEKRRNEILSREISGFVSSLIKEKKLLQPNETIVINYKIQKGRADDTNQSQVVILGVSENLKDMVCSGQSSNVFRAKSQ